jgi:DNA damage-binding protein 1
MAYNYVVTSQRPTAISHAMVCSFTGPDAKNLIVSKGNRLEIHNITAEGISSVTEFVIYGTVASLDHYRLSNDRQDMIFVLTAKKYFCVLRYDAEHGKIVSRATGCVRDRIGRDSELGPSAFMDPENRMIAMSLYERHLKLIPMEADGMRHAYNVRIEELKPIDVKFLHGCDKPTLCLLSEDNRGSRHLSTYTVDPKNKSLIAGPWRQKNVDAEAAQLLPVMEPMRGVLCFARTTISYVSGGTASAAGSTQTIGVKPMFVTSFGRIDENGTRYAVGDDKGNLFVLVIICSSNGTVTSLALEYLGNTSISTALCYLGNGFVFVGSSLADSQLIRLRTRREQEEAGAGAGAGSSSGSPGQAALAPVIEVVSTYMNIGPILDMAVVKSASNSQAQIVTCSGALRDGSLRVVRSGIGLQEQVHTWRTQLCTQLCVFSSNNDNINI